MKKIIFLSVLFCFVNSFAYADVCTWDDNTCSISSISSLQSAVDEVKTNALGKEGKVVIQLPSGSQTFSSIVNVNMTSGFSGINELVIRGHGDEQERGSTGDTHITNGFLNVNMNSAKRFRVSNLTIGGRNNTSGAFGLIDFDGTTGDTTGWRMDHITWDYPTGLSYRAKRTDCYGVIDHNNGISRSQFGGATETNQIGNTSWINGAELGSIHAVYYEDNDITFDMEGSSYNESKMIANGAGGARIVLRRNKITNYYAGMHDASTPARAGLQYEIYDNTFYNNITTRVTPAVFHRGGTGVIYNNDFYHVNNWFGGSSTAISFRNVRDGTFNNPGGAGYTGAAQVCGDSDLGAVLGPTETGWKTGGCNPLTDICLDIDGGPGTEYPCRDQIGTGNNTTPQASYPFLVWNNEDIKCTSLVDGVCENPVVTNATVTSQSSHILANRDYCYDADNMPTVCNGVPTTYVEFQYPHPLVTGDFEEEPEEPEEPTPITTTVTVPLSISITMTILGEDVVIEQVEVIAE